MRYSAVDLVVVLAIWPTIWRNVLSNFWFCRLQEGFVRPLLVVAHRWGRCGARSPLLKQIGGVFLFAISLSNFQSYRLIGRHWKDERKLRRFYSSTFQVNRWRGGELFRMVIITIVCHCTRCEMWKRSLNLKNNAQRSHRIEFSTVIKSIVFLFLTNHRWTYKCLYF